MSIMIGNANALLSAVKFDSQGLVPVIAQDRATGVVRMLAWANADALRATVQSGLATFWSRSRNEFGKRARLRPFHARARPAPGLRRRRHPLHRRRQRSSCHTNATSAFSAA